MNKPNLITEAVWLTLIGLIYFIGIYTSDRNLNAFNGSFSDSVLDKLKKKGLLGPFNIQVLLTTFVFTFPLWFHRVLANSFIYPYLIYLSLGCFLSPLVLSSKLAPSGDDLRKPAVYLLRWIASKLDSWLKNLLLLGICIVVSLIPFLNLFGRRIAESIFPVVENRRGTPFFNELITGFLLAVIITHIVRLSMLMINSVWFCFIYCFAIAFCWVDFQWLINESFFKQSLAKLIAMTFLITVLWDLILDLILSALERLSNSKIR